MSGKRRKSFIEEPNTAVLSGASAANVDFICDGINRALQRKWRSAHEPILQEKHLLVGEICYFYDGTFVQRELIGEVCYAYHGTFVHRELIGETFRRSPQCMCTPQAWNDHQYYTLLCHNKLFLRVDVFQQHMKQTCTPDGEVGVSQSGSSSTQACLSAPNCQISSSTSRWQRPEKSRG